MSTPARLLLLLACVGQSGCLLGYPAHHEIQGDASDQIWLSEASQVKVRNAQTRVFDTTDRTAMLEAVVTTLQDLGFQIELLDEVLGIVSAKKFVALNRSSGAELPLYLMYDEESLVVFNRTYRSWGPFRRRSDLVRLTVTVRSRNEQQLLVRASAQFALRAIERPDPYLQFFAALEQARFASRAAVDK